MWVCVVVWMGVWVGGGMRGMRYEGMGWGYGVRVWGEREYEGYAGYGI